MVTRRGRSVRRVLWATVALFCLGGGAFAAEEPSPEALEFFEKRVRPILVEHCHKCHGEKQQKGGLRLDSAAAVLKGGGTGPAIVPGDPKQSLLVNAISYDPDGYQMPPDGKLASHEIAALEEWIRRGAVFPGPSDSAKTQETINLAEGRKFWSFPA